jgi:hypothetical protein
VKVLHKTKLNCYVNIEPIERIGAVSFAVLL